jgi:DNA-binding NarL/FixJ family response regulator
MLGFAGIFTNDLKDTGSAARNMYWRSIREADLLECLEIQPACIGDRLLGRGETLRVWRELLATPAFQANVIESEAPIAGHRIVACGLGVFVGRTFVDRELAEPRPGLNSRIIASVASGDPCVLDREAIAAGNAGSGLDFVNLYGSWREGVLDDAALTEVQGLLGRSFVENFAGYRFNRVLKEAIGEPVIALARRTGSYRVVAEFSETSSALVMASPESARDAPYSVAMSMYRYQAPVLRLSPGEQTLLAAALDGKTDAELSAALGLSLEAVKKRWISIYARVEASRPELLQGADTGGTRRGPQKRHRVVAYVRAHPQELRPYAWDR